MAKKVGPVPSHQIMNYEKVDATINELKKIYCHS